MSDVAGVIVKELDSCIGEGRAGIIEFLDGLRNLRIAFGRLTADRRYVDHQRGGGGSNLRCFLLACVTSGALLILLNASTRPGVEELRISRRHLTHGVHGLGAFCPT